MKCGKGSVPKAKESDIQEALITLDAFPFDIHLALGSDNGFDIVRLSQRTHIHIVIHHEQLILQVCPGKAVCLNFLNAGGVHIDPEDRPHHQSDPGFAFAALSDHQEHLLGLRSRKQAISQVLLQGRDIFWDQKLRKEVQPDVRYACRRVVCDLQPVPAVFLFFTEMTVQIPGTV